MAGVEGEMANLKVSSPKGQEGSDEDTSIKETPPHLSNHLPLGGTR